MEHGEGEREPAAVELALDAWKTSFTHLVKLVEDGGLDEWDDQGLLGFLQDFEQGRNQLALIDHRGISDGDRRGLPAAVTQGSMRRVLVQLLRISPVEAARRCVAAEACAEQVTMHGEVLAPVRPHVAAAQRDGTVSPEQVDIIVRALGKVDRAGFDPADVDAGEQLLTQFATSFATPDLRRLAERTVDAINPDGTLPDDTLAQDRRHFTLRACRDGSYRGDFHLTGVAGAKLTALRQPLARPRVATIADDDGVTIHEDDTRTHGQRQHDALEEICDRVLRSGTVNGTGGTPATVIVTLTADDLRQRTGYGTTTDGTLIPTPQLPQSAREADIIPAVLNHTGAVLTLGRTRRIASTQQTHALIARDKGCSFPACDRGPEWCERHHIIEWADGGLTDLDNLTLLCKYHHHNHLAGGWTCRINTDRLPEWTPPKWLDRHQKPLINSRIVAEQLHQRPPRKPKPPPPHPAAIHDEPTPPEGAPPAESDPPIP